jgi:hypothetical protein
MILFVAPGDLLRVAKILEAREAYFYTIGNAHAGNREVVVDFRQE